MIEKGEGVLGEGPLFIAYASFIPFLGVVVARDPEHLYSPWPKSVVRFKMHRHDDDPACERHSTAGGATPDTAKSRDKAAIR